MKDQAQCDPMLSDPSQRNFVSLVSRTLSPSERNYSATKRELLAIVFALRKFHYYIWGAKFQLYTDHHALAFIFTQTHTNPMLDTWLDTLLDYQFDITHCPGTANVLPDALSRLFPDALSKPHSSDPVRLLRIPSAEIHH